MQGVRNHGRSSRRSIDRVESRLLMSYGDPDLSYKWRVLRKLQYFAREWDNRLYPDEVDVPGMTFASPVEWAPWMETIWFGNQYEYRSAYFHDVMYSNNKPFREGALLYNDPEKAKAIALLYQRYKKFDESSYALSNATFFNVFGTDTMRVGRYKVPLNDEVVLCTTDPLTFSEMKRYFNSISPFKWFKSKFMQQKRKRQYLLDINGGELVDGEIPKKAVPVEDINAVGIGGSDRFFLDSVHKIEYGRWEYNEKLHKRTAEARVVRIRPVSSIDASQHLQFDAYGRGGVILSNDIANSQYLLESLIQSTFNHICATEQKKCSVLRVITGGDHRLLNNHAMEVLTRISAANQARLLSISKDGWLSTAEACALLENSNKDGIAFVWTAGAKAGGIRGNLGLQVVTRVSGKSVEVLGAEAWTTIFDIMASNEEVRILPTRPNFGPFPIRDPLTFHGLPVKSMNAHGKYLAALKEQFSLDEIGTFLNESKLFFTIDCMNGASAPIMKRLLKEMGQDPKNVLINTAPSFDFNGKRPDPCPDNMLQDSQKLFAFDVPTRENLFSCEMTANTSSTSVRDTRLECEEDFSPDIGFALDANAQKCTVFVRNLYMRDQETLAAIDNDDATTRDPSDGIHIVLGWLERLAMQYKTGDNTSKLAMDVMQNQWQTEGRQLKIDVELADLPEEVVVDAIMRLSNATDAHGEARGQANGDDAWYRSLVMLSTDDVIVDMTINSTTNSTSSRDLARTTALTITADTSCQQAIGIAGLCNLGVTIFTEDIAEGNAGNGRKAKDQDDEHDEASDVEGEGLLGSRGLLEMMEGNDQEEKSPAMAKLCFEIELQMNASADVSVAAPTLFRKVLDKVLQDCGIECTANYRVGITNYF